MTRTCPDHVHNSAMQPIALHCSVLPRSTLAYFSEFERDIVALHGQLEDSIDFEEAGEEIMQKIIQDACKTIYT